MKKQILWVTGSFSVMLATLITVGLTGCGDKDEDPPEKVEKPVETYDKVDYDKLELTWSDEFEGTEVDLKKWNYRAEGTERGKSGQFSAIVDRSTISLDGQGHCSIKVLKVDDTHYLVGQLGTDGIFKQCYGYFECRAKMNKQLGAHVAFWLQSSTMSKNPELNDPGTNGTEIDIFEYHRKTPGIVYFNLHWNGYGEYHKTVGSKYSYPEIMDGWHTFGLRWSNTGYIFYVDGKKCWETNQGLSRTAEYLILSTELTGWGGNPLESTFPDEVLFDYVRVYKFKQ